MATGFPNGQTPHPAYQLARDFLSLLTLLFALYTSRVSVQNNDKIESVERKQEVAATTAGAVKEQLEAKAEEDGKMTGVQLYSTWRYLQDVSDVSGHPRDAVKAAEAKKLYEEYVRKSGPQKPPK